MVDDVTGKSSSTGSLADALNGASSTKAKKKDQLGKDEFLTLLIQQLKNQDPLDPMKNDQLAVNLAQFSQLEQLIDINKKVGGDNGISSLAGYLGNEVTLNTDTLHFGDGASPTLKLTLLQDAKDIKIELLDDKGQVKETFKVNQMASGENRVRLEGTSLKGDYKFRVSGVGVVGGQNVTPHAEVIGVVNGFVPGDNPQLIVDGREVSPGQVTRVNVVPSNNASTTQ